jgi:general stress protein YciG
MAEGITVYRLTKDQAETMLRNMGHMATTDLALDRTRAAELQEKGGAAGKLARHASKWLRDDGSETTIPLTDQEHDELADQLGGRLEAV